MALLVPAIQDIGELDFTAAESGRRTNRPKAQALSHTTYWRTRLRRTAVNMAKSHRSQRHVMGFRPTLPRHMPLSLSLS